MKPHEALRRLGKAPDAVLHNAMEKTELCRHMGGLYILTVTDNADVDRFREVICQFISMLLREIERFFFWTGNRAVLKFTDLQIPVSFYMSGRHCV